MPDNMDTPIKQLKTKRVQRAVDELNEQLKSAIAHAKEIKAAPRPSILAIDPDSGTIGSTVRVAVYGDNFQPGAEVRLTRSGPPEERITGKHVVVVSSKLVTAEFELTEVSREVRGRVVKFPLADTADSLWTVVVINPDRQYDWRERVFVLHPAEGDAIEDDSPDIEAVDFTVDDEEHRFDAEIQGTNLHPGNVEISAAGNIASPSEVSVRPRTGDLVIARFDGDAAWKIWEDALSIGRLTVTLTNANGVQDSARIILEFE